MKKPWTVRDAKAHLSEVLRRSRAGEPQRIGVSDGCVVVAASDWRAAQPIDLGAWLAASALVRDAVIATRNVRGFEPLGVAWVDPWAA